MQSEVRVFALPKAQPPPAVHDWVCVFWSRETFERWSATIYAFNDDVQIRLDQDSTKDIKAGKSLMVGARMLELINNTGTDVVQALVVIHDHVIRG